MKAVFVKAGIQGEKGSNVEVAWDLADPFAQSLVLRAYLAASGELTDDIRAAKVTHFVLARGPGRLSATSPASLSDGLPSSVVGEIESERGKLLGIAVEDDPVPRCWPVYAQTSKGVAVNLLDTGSLFGTDLRSWHGVDMTYYIFGQKIKDWPGWVLLQPLHVWVEPSAAPPWG